MARIEFATTASGPFYAFPGSESNFTNWATLRVEVPGSLDRYAVEVDDMLYGPIWYVFQSAATPTSWADAFAISDFTIEQTQFFTGVV